VKPAKEMKAFLDWALSPAGQEIVAKVGYFPVK
jgi:phosphate transport system substrate-binding protein